MEEQSPPQLFCIMIQKFSFAVNDYLEREHYWAVNKTSALAFIVAILIFLWVYFYTYKGVVIVHYADTLQNPDSFNYT